MVIIADGLKAAATYLYGYLNNMAALLSDNFNDDTLDTALWDVAPLNNPNAGVTVAETGQQLVITPLASTAGTNRNGLMSDATYDFTFGYAVWHLPQIAGVGSGSINTRCGLALDANNWFGFDITSNFTCRKVQGGVASDTNLGFSTTLFKYLMVFFAGARASWWYSTDGKTWVHARSGETLSFAVTALKVFIDAGTTASVAVSPASSIFDNIEAGGLEIDTSHFALAVGFNAELDVEPSAGLPIIMQLSPDDLGGDGVTLIEGQDFPRE